MFNQKEVLGLRGEDKILIIIRLQAYIRGVLARKKVKIIYGYDVSNSRKNRDNGGVENYENPVVAKIKKRLGPFNYSVGSPTKI